MDTRIDAAARIILAAGARSHFAGGVSENRVTLVEDMLGVSLPDSYKWFLGRYGHGGIGGVEILGVTAAEVPPCVTATRFNRNYGLPTKFVVIESCDEWLSCLDTSTMHDGECLVVDWDWQGKTVMWTYSDFLELLLDRFENAIENLPGVELS